MFGLKVHALTSAECQNTPNIPFTVLHYMNFLKMYLKQIQVPAGIACRQSLWKQKSPMLQIDLIILDRQL